jgi:hypothetical protein
MGRTCAVGTAGYHGPHRSKEPLVSSLLIRLVCGVLFAAMALGAVVHPPDNLTQGLGMLLPGAMLLNYAIRGPRRSLVPRRRAPAPPSTGSGSAQP